MSDAFLKKFTFACLAVAFVSVVVHAEANRRYHFSIVHADKDLDGRAAGLSVVTRARSRVSAERAERDRAREIEAMGWRRTQAEINDSEEFHESFAAMFRDRPTKAPYLSYNDAEGREVRVYFFGAAPARDLILSYREGLAGERARDVREVLPEPAK